MTLLARLGPRPKNFCPTPAYPRLLALAAVAVLGACGGVVTSPNQEATTGNPETTAPLPNTAGGDPGPYHPSPESGTAGSTGVGGSLHLDPGGAGGMPYVPPPSTGAGGGIIAPPYLVPDAGAKVPTEAAPPGDPDAGSPNPAGGEPVTFDAGVLAE